METIEYLGDLETYGGLQRRWQDGRDTTVGDTAEGVSNWNHDTAESTGRWFGGQADNIRDVWQNWRNLTE